MNAIPEKVLSDAVINSAYAENGQTFETRDEAESYMKYRGYRKANDTYRNKIGKQAFIYKLRKTVFVNKEGLEVVGHKPNGFLVSFGGVPRSGYELKITKVPRPAGS